MAILMVLAILTAFCFTLDLVFGTKLFGIPSRSYGARVLFTAAVRGIIGKVGEAIFQRWKSGVTTLRHPASTIKNPNSSNQAQMRAVVSYLSARWNSTLTENQRDVWREWAQDKPFSGPNTGGVNQLIKHNNGIFSGMNCYVAANAKLVKGGLAVVDDAPIVAVPPTPPLAVAVACAAGTATVTWTEPLTHKTPSQARIWVRIESTNIHKQEVANADVTLGTKDITHVKGANGASIPLTSLVGAKLYVQMETIDTDGTRSAESNLAYIIIA